MKAYDDILFIELKVKSMYYLNVVFHNDAIRKFTRKRLR